MKIVITDMQGNPVSSSVSLRLRNLLSRVHTTGKLMQDALSWTVKDHFMTIYPESKHYSPDKVTSKDFTNGENPTATIDIDVPGVTRAYHDMDIRPRIRKFLTIPMHRMAYGKKASDFDELFVLNKKDTGKSYLVQKTPGTTQLTFLFRLVKRVFQKQDRRLMPSDKTLANNIFANIEAYLDRTMRF